MEQIGGDGAQLHQSALAAQAATELAQGGRTAQEVLGQQADQNDQGGVHLTHPSACPADSAGQFHRISAQGIGGLGQAGRRLGGDDDRLEPFQGTRESSRQAIRQQAKGLMSLGAVPARDQGARRVLAGVGAMTGEAAAPAGMGRTVMKTCLSPRLPSNVGLAGEARFES